MCSLVALSCLLLGEMPPICPDVWAAACIAGSRLYQLFSQFGHSSTNPTSEKWKDNKNKESQCCGWKTTATALCAPIKRAPPRHARTCLHVWIIALHRDIQLTKVALKERTRNTVRLQMTQLQTACESTAFHSVFNVGYIFLGKKRKEKMSGAAERKAPGTLTRSVGLWGSWGWAVNLALEHPQSVKWRRW